MSKAQPWGRVALTGAVVAVCTVACQSVLDIDEPKPLAEAGAAGEGGSSSTATGGSTSGGAPNPGLAGEGGQSISVSGSAGAGGDGGAIITPECEDNELRCSGDTDKTPQICVDGRWSQNTEEAAGDCDVLCDSGRCVECTGNAKRCSVCEDGDDSCSQRVPQTCEDGAWVSASQPCEHYCSGEGVCGEPPSCAEGPAADCDGESCCLSLYVPGGEFKRNYSEAGPFNDPSFPAKISPFLLDKFEVTVSRMQHFVAAFNAIDLNDGAGKAPHIKDDVGWSRSGNKLPEDDVALQAALSSCTGSTWIPNPASQLPINCVNFAIAYAFCIWDGGRLPTDAEWNFAAAGGAEQRLRAWKSPLSGPDIDSSFAVFDQASPLDVGSKPKGNGRWGHADMMGNVGEFVLDFASDLSPTLCEDCVFLTPTDNRTIRGGTFNSTEELIITTYPDIAPLDSGDSVLGFRCARDIE